MKNTSWKWAFGKIQYLFIDCSDDL